MGLLAGYFTRAMHLLVPVEVNEGNALAVEWPATFKSAMQMTLSYKVGKLAEDIICLAHYRFGL